MISECLTLHPTKDYPNINRIRPNKNVTPWDLKETDNMNGMTILTKQTVKMQNGFLEILETLIALPSVITLG
jgi:hypothetical protein